MPPLTEANQAVRAGRVTASQIGVLTGSSPWGSPLEVFNWVFHGQSDFKDSPAIQMGHALEPVGLRLASGSRAARSAATT